MKIEFERIGHRTAFLITVIAFFAAHPAAQAWGSSPDVISEKTEVLNSYGEPMELAFELWDQGTEGLIKYETYGEFIGLGTGDYKYKIIDRKGLAKAAGEGIYPSSAVYQDPAFKKISQSGKLRGSHWDFTNIDNHQLSFYKWASAPETPGVKQYFTAVALENAGLLKHALKAYHAVAVHFPNQVGWTFWHTPIYYAHRAMDKLEYLTRQHPELGLDYVDFEFEVENGDNLTVADDKYTAINPGRFVPTGKDYKEPVADLSKLEAVRKAGSDHVELVQFSNGHWQLRVDGKPFFVKAIAYEPTPVGQSTHDGSRKDWMTADSNANGLIDGPFESWVDENWNNEQDPGEAAVGDFKLLKDMGVNALRHYHGASSREMLRVAYEKYGMMAIIGDLMGMYAGGSGAKWYEGTDYANPEHLENMRESIRRTVMKHKDEPYLLMWVLSNEGNYGFPGIPEGKTLPERLGLGSKGKLQPVQMYTFANEMARMIKSMDPEHPVAFSNGETVFIQTSGKLMTDVDVFGANVYRGADGFGYSFWHDVKEYTGKPALITEFGCPAFHNRKTLEEAAALQRNYLRGNWADIYFNRAGSGHGNALGGVLYEFIDEWWKAGPAPEFDPYLQETIGDFKAAFPDGWMHEEWLGVTGQGDGSNSPFMRQLRPAYFYFKEAWNHDVFVENEGR